MKKRRILAGVVLALLLGGWLGHEIRSSRAPSLSALADALGERRFLEPRLTGGFSYASCRPVHLEGRLIPSALCSLLSRPPGRGSTEASIASDVRGLQTSVLAGRRSEDPHLVGASLLAFPEKTGQAAAAVETLARAADLAPGDAGVRNDLAAAHFALALEEDEPAELVRALASIEEALRIAPALPEARFNRALILDRLYLRDQALQAWRSYLEVDDGRGWRVEADQNVRRLEQVPGPERWRRRLTELDAAALSGNLALVRERVAQAPQEAREHAGEEVLGKWGDLLVAGRREDAADADQRLRIARTLGQALRELTGESSIATAVGTIDAALADSRQAANVTALARAHRAYRDGMAKLRIQLVDEAQFQFRAAADDFSRAHSPSELWALYGLAGVDLTYSRYDAAVRDYGIVADRAAQLGSPAFEGLAQRCIGLAMIRQGRLSESLQHYQTAALLLGKVREAQNLGATHEMIAENLRFLGQSSAAWRYRYRAAAELSPYRDSLRLHNVLWEGGWAAVEDGLPRAALQIQDEGLAVAKRSGKPRMLAEALIWRSKILLALKNAPGAMAALEQAASLNQTPPGQWVRNRLESDILYVKGEALRRIDPNTATKELGHAIDYYRDNKLYLDAADAYLSRARAFLALGRLEAGESDLTAAVELFEAQRARLTDPGLLLSYTESAQRLFDEMILLKAWGGEDPAEAFSVSERARNLDLEAASDFEVQRVLEHLPANTVVIEYAVVRDRLFTWMVHDGKVQAFRRRLTPGDLERRIGDFMASLRSRQPQDQIARAADRLSDLLLPAEGLLPPGTELCFVPDKQLNEVPFAALRSPMKRYLIQDHTIRILPSASLYLRAGSAPRRAPGSPGALLVGATEFDRGLFSHLPSLQGVAQEIAEIGQLYRQPLVIEGSQATRSRLLDEMDRHEVFQYAGHAVFNPRYPSHSFFLLAPEAGNEGLLFAHEIASHQFNKLRLVVLSACSTLGPLSTRTGGLSGMARPFLAAGVPAVLGTLWDIQDKPARHLMPEFHRRWLASGNAAEALHDAQLALMQSPDPALRSPASWASFELVGGLN